MEAARALASRARKAIDRSVEAVRTTTSAAVGAAAGVGRRITYEDPKGRRFRVRSLLSDAGRFGQVYVADEMVGVGAEQRPTGQPFALKVVALTAENKNDVQREALVMSQLSGHPHIVRLESAFNLQRSAGHLEAVFVMEYCGHGSLLDAVNDTTQPMGERTVLEAFLDVCQGVAHMHSRSPPLAHRDIKLENVLRGNSLWKLCDFGSATAAIALPTTETERQRVGADIERNTTLCYRAPEMVDLFRRQLICEKVDVWALGCLLFKMAFLHDAFDEGALQILNNRPHFPKQSPFSAAFSELVRFMLVSDPALRPDVGMVAARVAVMLGVPNPCATFKAPDHSPAAIAAASSSSAVDPPLVAAETTQLPRSHQRPTPSATPTTKQQQQQQRAPSQDIMSLLNWTTDSQSTAPRPASIPSSSDSSPPPLGPVPASIIAHKSSFAFSPTICFFSLSFSLSSSLKTKQNKLQATATTAHGGFLCVMAK